MAASCLPVERLIVSPVQVKCPLQGPVGELQGTSVYSSFVSLGKFIPTYLILFVAEVNGIDSLIYLSDFSLLVYRNASAFCVLILYPQFSSVAQSCPTLCDPMNRSTPGLPVHHQLPEFTQTHVHRVGNAIQPYHPLLSPSPPAPKPSQYQNLFQ